MRHFLLILFLFNLLFSASFAQDLNLILSLKKGELKDNIILYQPENDPSWGEPHRKGNLRVYLRERKGSKIKEAIGISEFDAPCCLIFQIVTNTKYLVDFMPYIKLCYVLFAEEKHRFLCQYLDFPIIGDRFYDLEVSDFYDYQGRKCEYINYWELTDKYKCTDDIYLKAIPKFDREKAVYTPENLGYWHLVPLENGRRCRGEYYVFTDPGGKLPIWAVNLSTTKAIPDVFEAVENRLKHPKLFELYENCSCE